MSESEEIQYANKAFRNLLPEKADLSGLKLDRLGIAEETGMIVRRKLQKALDSGQEERFRLDEILHPPLSGADCRIIPVQDRQVILEISPAASTKKVEKKLQDERIRRHQSDMLRQRARRIFFDVIDELPVFVYMQRRDYSVAYANKRTRAFYGELDGRKCYEMFSGRKDPCPHCPTFRVFETGKPVDWQFTDAAGRTFHIYDYPFEDEDGQPLVMELGVDITELKRVERELYQAQKMRAIGVLAGGMAHDLNNNLVPIIFNIDYALGKAADTEMDAPLSEALKAAYKAAELVEQVLEYSRQQEVSRYPMRLTPMAQDSLGLLQASLPDQVTLETDYEAASDCVLANSSQIQQILLNLCRNAVQAMPDGGTLHVKLSNLRIDSKHDAPHQDLPLGDHVVMTVSDTGHGMKPDMIERIFEPFYTSKKKSGGTGMGLAVVHAIVTCNGGSIHVKSAPGEGTCFTVYFPCCETPEEKTLTTRLPVSASRTTGRLLIVDDDMGALQAMKRVLRDAGYEVSTADNGSEGLKEYFRAKGEFDLVISDQSMPAMTGIEMARSILKNAPEAKIVICTGHVENNLETAAEEIGIAGFIMKPMSPRVLVENVSRFCA